ncbi:MAG: XTP/dITP diphosphatase [Sporomusaceae bacterium]|nr:XTP/dITP diphosphatase [Sporomusaceae bacterium]
MSKRRSLTVASKNAGKIAEIRAAFSSLPFTVIPVSDCGDFAEPEETGATFAANAELKARYYAAATGTVCLADDSGLEVDALDGAPGVYSARFAGPEADDAANNAKLLRLLAGIAPERRTARFRCVLVCFDPCGEMLTADGVCEGVILEQPRGNGGFGYDPLFYLPVLGKTLAEITLAEKNALSHRGAALRALVNLLQTK